MASQSDRVFLVGPMGAGKTTLGRQLARTLGFMFIDSDHEIEKRTGASIAWIFDIEGEAGFRKREAIMIDELTQRSHVMLATGGGAVLDPQNRARLRERGVVIYLYADIDKLAARAGRDASRPLLANVDPRQKLTELMAVREPLYREVADLVMDTGDRPLRSTISRLAKTLRPMLGVQDTTSTDLDDD